MLGKFSFFCLLLILFNLNSKESSRNTLRMSNSLDRDQAQHFVGPDLGPNCLQMLSADWTSKQRIIKGYFSIFHGMYHGK